MTLIIVKVELGLSIKRIDGLCQAPIKKFEFLVVNVGIFNRYLRWLLIKVCSLYHVPVRKKPEKSADKTAA